MTQYLKYLFPGLLVATACSFFYPSFGLTNVLIVLLSLAWLINGKLKEKLQAFMNNKLALIFCGLPIIYLLSLAWSQNPGAGLSLVEKKLLLILFPLILSTTDVSANLLKKLLVAFVATAIVASIVSTISVGFNYLSSDEAIAVMYFRDEFAVKAGMDIPYFALYLDLAILAVIYLITTTWKDASYGWKLLAFLSAAILVAISLVLSARMPLIALFVLAIAAYGFFIRRYPLYGSISLAVVIIIAGLAFSKLTFIGQRFKEIVDTKWEPPVGIHHNSTNLRIGTYNCSFELLRSNWVTGMGVGDVQPALNECYQTKGYSDVMYLESYNSHSEYLNIWLNIGVVGIGLFLLSLSLPLWRSLRQGNYLYAAFLGLMILSFITECVLERQRGIYLYAFFNSLLAFASPGIKDYKKDEPKA